MKRWCKGLERIIRDILLPPLVRGAFWSFRHAPPDVLKRMGARFGTAAFALARSQRRRSIENLSGVFGATKTPREIRDIARASFRNFGMAVAECAAYAAMTPDRQRAFVSVDGMQRLRQALALERGVVALTAHFGNFMILGPRLAAEGIGVSLVVKRMQDPGMERFFQELRTDMGIHTICLEPAMECARGCLNALKRNEVLVLLSDQHHKRSRGGVVVDFFGRPVVNAPGAAALALTNDSPVLPMFMMRNGDGSNRLVIEERVPVARSGRKAEDVAANTQTFTKIIESRIARHPDHWSWMYRRWRHREN